ncbi:unnamed protein product [Spirodela intermedia]|uniref:Uncharacterized protein n=1 Tax=Spirodela intermedia TaxID=51605 RepID=A0A7I8J0B0_SPIIN|nr:unnamed protein product [Spirodela intermedia]CAA6663469.1 unnamed protein product [Spirodela intermedia]
MGCGGSKQEVATGATLSVRRRLRKKPDSAAVTGGAAHPSLPLSPAADVKDITVNTDGEAVVDPKDDESVDAITGAQYFSPRCEPHGEETGDKEAPLPAMEGAAGDAADGPKSPAGAPISSASAADGSSPVGESGELNSNAEVKEPLLIEETRVEQVIIVKKRSINTSEIVADVSDH